MRSISVFGFAFALLWSSVVTGSLADPPIPVTRPYTPAIYVVPTATPNSLTKRAGSNLTLRAADGTNVTRLGGLAASSIIIVGGKSITVGAIRKNFRDLTLSHPGTIVKVPLAGHPLSPQIFAKRVVNQDVWAPGAAHSNFSRAGTAPELNSEYCKTHAAYLLNVQGKVTPEGTIVVSGVCFGGRGGKELRLEGRFDGGALPLSIENWDDGSITAVLPAVRGVFDQDVKLEILQGSIASNGLPLKFTATREVLPLPTRFIQNTFCDPAGFPNSATCSELAGSRMDIETPNVNANVSGADVWSASLPPGWELDELDYQSSYGSVTEYGFEGPGSSWKMAWTAGLTGPITAHHECVLIVCSTFTDTPIFGSSYSMTVTAIGPAGTMPP